MARFEVDPDGHCKDNGTDVPPREPAPAPAPVLDTRLVCPELETSLLDVMRVAYLVFLLAALGYFELC